MKKIIYVTLLLMIFSISIGASAGVTSVPPHNTIDYYEVSGMPNIRGSFLSNPEFEKGETRVIEVNLANKGVIQALRINVVPQDPPDIELAQNEMEKEKMRTVAQGVKAELGSSTDYIEVRPETSVYTLKALKPGMILEHPLRYTIDIDNNAPAGNYSLNLAVSYSYQSQVRTVTNNEILRDVAENPYVSYYKNASTSITFPVEIKESPNFEITDSRGNISADEGSIINITYKNIGENVAEDASVKLVVMDPLEMEHSIATLGDVKPDETVTASFEFSTGRDVIPKNYSISSSVKYFDDEGIQYSNVLSSKVEVLPSDKWMSLSTLALLIIMLLIIYLIGDTVKNKRNNKGV
ncbi:COG1361 S-layer family protein [Methanohalophilus mahii]|uniref:S-layer domain protein n=1 Tax=Methanohalophilus mahii (strain ATCC 35705 / DSM 5219 / SLP) TaxID=547558 RepID=D5E936_METMS|nr:hypothetical protein [Methanohalophilus mahii]ADE35687.1 hypothetical protein Mmah_0152 [Methanohalophilus mahii DSM 5219]